MFKIFDVTGATTDRPEMVGTKEKFWLVPSQGMDLPIVPYLFKIGRPGTGENWAEKVCREILHHVSLPCADYEFAKFENESGVISRQINGLNEQLVTANTVLEKFVEDFDGTLTFRQRKYQVSTPFNLIRIRSVAAPKGLAACHSALSPADVFVGYLVFDALVGNTDRHAQNWAIITDYSDQYSTKFSLSPTFDHASSLGRELTNENRKMRLTTRDKRANVAAYCGRASSAFYGPDTSKTLLQIAVLDELSRLAPSATKYWATVFSAVPMSVYTDIFSRIAPDLISIEATTFALQMLNTNSEMIKSYAV